MHRLPRHFVGAAVCCVWGAALAVLPGCAEAADESDAALAQNEAGSAAAVASAAEDASMSGGGRVAADEEGWEETAGLQLLVDGVIDPGARIFDAPDFQHTLVVTSSGAGYLLALRAQEVHSLAQESIAWTGQKLPTPDVDSGESAGMFMNDGGLLLFDTDSGSYQVQPEPPLVGALTLEKLRAAKPDYVLLADEFEPDPAMIEGLKASAGGTVRVFFGTWCSYCKHWLPHFMKTMERVGDKFTVEYYGVSEDLSEPADELSKYDVSETPSFIVYRNGNELGRILEEPIDSMESDLLQIVSN